MFKKTFIVALLTILAGSFTLYAAPSKEEIKKQFKTFFAKEWHKSFFVPAAHNNKAFDEDKWEYGLDFELEEYVTFHPTKITERSGKLTVTGYFEDKDGLESEEDVYTFVFAKRSGKWLIAQVFYTDKSKKKFYKYNFQKGKMETLPDVEW